MFIKDSPQDILLSLICCKKRTSETGVKFAKLAIKISFNPRKIITYQKIDMVYLCCFISYFCPHRWRTSNKEFQRTSVWQVPTCRVRKEFRGFSFSSKAKRGGFWLTLCAIQFWIDTPPPLDFLVFMNKVCYPPASTFLLFININTKAVRSTLKNFFIQIFTTLTDGLYIAILRLPC